LIKEKDDTRYVYIYNPFQASFYASKGVMMLETGTHPTTKKTWYRFGYDSSLEAYREWCSRNR